LADAWDGHQPTAGRRGSCHTSHDGVDRGDAVRALSCLDVAR
jgi:hypothetical protein